MVALYKVRAEELDSTFLETLKRQFEGREIEISVCDTTASSEDETEYLLRSPANRERLIRALENVRQGTALKTLSLDDIQ